MRDGCPPTERLNGRGQRMFEQCGGIDMKHWFKTKASCNMEAWVAARDADNEAEAEACSGDRRQA